MEIVNTRPARKDECEMEMDGMVVEASQKKFEDRIKTREGGRACYTSTLYTPMQHGKGKGRKICTTNKEQEQEQGRQGSQELLWLSTRSDDHGYRDDLELLGSIDEEDAVG